MNALWEDAVVWLRSQIDQGELVRACFYDDPVLAAAERYYNGSEWRAVQQLLTDKRGGVALDLGAGRGIASYALASDGWKVTALEPDPSDIVGVGAIRSLVRDANLAINVVQGWGESLPFPDASFNLVHGRQVLHHAQDLNQICREIARVLKPGGLLVATREHVISTHQDLPAFLDSHPLHQRYGGEHAYPLGEYIDAIVSNGLTLRKVLNPYQSDINLFPDTMAALKRRLPRRYRLLAGWVPDLVLGWLGARLTIPGRIFSFVASKK